MKDVFTPDQMADLMAINEICAELEAALVLIGAMSLIVSMDDIGRFTRDVDLTVALDLDEFALLTERLAAAGWTRVPRLEHRWIAPRKTIVDLLPAGPKLRSAGSIEWPLSQFAMSLAGFDHVFVNAVDLPLTNGAHIRVAPPIVTVLLKMMAYTGDPYRRAKDLGDIRRVLERYEADSDRFVLRCCVRCGASRLLGGECLSQLELISGRSRPRKRLLTSIGSSGISSSMMSENSMRTTLPRESSEVGFTPSK